MLLACAYPAQKQSLSFDQNCAGFNRTTEGPGEERCLRTKKPDRAHRDQPSSCRDDTTFPWRLEAQC